MYLRIDKSGNYETYDPTLRAQITYIDLYIIKQYHVALKVSVLAKLIKYTFQLTQAKFTNNDQWFPFDPN